jgi:hypothetical protein
MAQWVRSRSLLPGGASGEGRRAAPATARGRGELARPRAQRGTLGTALLTTLCLQEHPLAGVVHEKPFGLRRGLAGTEDLR